MIPLHFLLSLLLLPVLSILSMTPSCTEEEQRRLAIAHSKCVDDVSERLLSGNEPQHVRVCNGLTEQVHKCGTHFQDCMDEQELRLFKDVQIDTFAKLMGTENLGHLLSECEIVREFKGSGRTLVKATDLCDVTQVEKAVERREGCVQTEKAKLHSTLKGVRSKLMLDEAICGFVNKALHGCMEELHECYSNDEFVEIKKTSYELLEKVLMNLGGKFDLDTCSNQIETALLRSSATSTVAAKTTLMAAAAILTLLFATTSP